MKLENFTEPGEIYDIKCENFVGRGMYDELDVNEPITEIKECMYVRPETISERFADGRYRNAEALMMMGNNPTYWQVFAHVSKYETLYRVRFGYYSELTDNKDGSISVPYLVAKQVAYSGMIVGGRSKTIDSFLAKAKQSTLDKLSGPRKEKFVTLIDELIL